jgi:hypothetical protein
MSGRMQVNWTDGGMGVTACRYVAWAGGSTKDCKLPRVSSMGF